jgi:hypothetical protein
MRLSTSRFEVVISAKWLAVLAVVIERLIH